MNESSLKKQNKRRLFLAVCPDNKTRKALNGVAHQCHKQVGGKRVAEQNLHLTLVFLGAMDIEQQRCVEQVASSINVSPFSLTLTHTGYWPKPKVCWLAPELIPLQLQQLVDDLNKYLSIKCGFKPESRTYHPHLTLLRKARKSVDVKFEKIDWNIARFSLLESRSTDTGVEYITLQNWDLIKD